MSNIAIVFNNKTRNKMMYQLNSLEFQGLNIDFIPEFSIENYHKILICDNEFNYEMYNKKIILIISDYNANLKFSENISFIQYESNKIKEMIEEKYEKFKEIDNIVMNVLPLQKLEINPLDTQDATIFFSGVDKPENMVDEMFDLDAKVHYEIKFYDEQSKVEPSKLHRLSWNITIDKNLIGIIHYKILKEIENGCLPILLKESIPSYFSRYPFLISLDELKEKDKLIEAVKEMSSFISKMTRDEFSMLANSIYNGIYINSNWKYNNYIIATKIKETLDK